MPLLYCFLELTLATFWHLRLGRFQFDFVADFSLLVVDCIARLFGHSLSLSSPKYKLLICGQCYSAAWPSLLEAQHYDSSKREIEHMPYGRSLITGVHLAVNMHDDES